MHPCRIPLALGIAAAMLGRSNVAAAQGTVHAMAQAIPLITRADPTAGRRALTEGYVTQPLIMARWSLRSLRAVGMLNLEGLSLERGELSTGMYGEGYVDRRHPHAYVHELMLGGESDLWRGIVGGSLFVGRGFVPFGSDDPMVRPLVKYPVNHHLAQILERVVAVAAIRTGPAIAEVARFNGDEPLSPGSSPRFERFGDSWAARLTLLPMHDLELSGSLANVVSPEQPSGHGVDQRKSSLVARTFSSGAALSRYALVEWAETVERSGSVRSTLRSALGEGAVCHRVASVAARVERTDRVEEEPLLDPFRVARPAADLNNLGFSRWLTLTGSVAVPGWRWRAGVASPFLEVARTSVAHGSPPGIFDPQLRYGSNRMWMYSIGLRLRAGARHARLGRYSVGRPASRST